MPYGPDIHNPVDHDVIMSAFTRHRPDLVFLQMSPENFIARQRFLSQKHALKGIEDYDVKAIECFDPHVPVTWEECVVNLVCLKGSSRYDRRE